MVRRQSTSEQQLVQNKKLPEYIRARKKQIQERDTNFTFYINFDEINLQTLSLVSARV